MFFILAFLFMFGSVAGWGLELFFRRIFSMKKWINPGFLNGPYLPMYGFGTVILYAACFIPMPRWGIVIFLFVALTLLEYITGLIFIKGMKIKLWDYSTQWGNIQGIICPLFSVFWGVIAAIFVYLLFNPLKGMAEWAAGSMPMVFVLGVFYGVFFVDLCISFNVSLKIRKATRQLKVAVHYEELKAAINERRQIKKQHKRFLFPFAGASFRDSVNDWYAKKKEAIRAAMAKKATRKKESNEKDNINE